MAFVTSAPAHPPVASERADRIAAAAPAVSIEHLSKTFRLPHRQYSTLKERALHPLTARTFDELRAVQDVNVDIHEGEFFGIVGRNGSGKSTLLKCLAGIYKADEGYASIRGRLSPFIELGVGFNPDLTARDNVMINAIMLGLTRRQARERFDEIIAFAELEEFLDLKLKNYSSGMSVRLAFSVAVQVDADILLVDEVLAVGDVAFQQKCFDQFHRLKDEGRTIVFVTHDMSAVERFCDRAMLLERGRVVSIGSPSAISRAYSEICFGGLEYGSADGARGGSHQAAEIRDAWFENEAGERVTTVGQSEGLHLCMDVAFHLDVKAPVYAFTLRNQVRHTVFATSSAAHEGVEGPRRAGDSVVARVAMQNWLAPGRYDLTPAVVGAAGRGLLDQREDLKTLIVHGTRHSGGVVDIPHSFEVGPA